MSEPLPPSTNAPRFRFRSLARMARYLRPYRWQVVVMAAAAAVGTGAGVAVPLVTQAIVDGPILEHRGGSLLPLGLLALALGLVEAGGSGLRRWLQAKGILQMEFDARDDLYAHLQGLHVGFHDAWQSGQLLSRAMSDLSTIRRFFGFGLIFLVVNAATFAVVVVLLVRLDPLLGGIVALSAIPIVAISATFERRYRVVSRAVQDATGDLTTAVEEGALGTRVVKSFGRAPERTAAFESLAGELYERSMRKVRLTGTFWSLLQVVPNLALAAIVGIGGLAVAQGHLSLGALVAFMTLLLLLVWPVESLGFILASAQEAATAADRVLEVLDSVPSVADPRHPTRLAHPRGSLRFEAVSFSYPGSEKRVLDGVELSIEPGETVALVGATGSGKTTLACLVPRLYDPTAGRVTLDGVSVADLAVADLRRLVGMAFEEPILFSVSVRENVLLGAAEATEADLEEALEAAQAGFVYDLPWGLDTRVGEQGLSLSGGQRQRLALARAIVGHPKVLVLDDPLSALDVHTEAIVEAALERMLATTTALVVAHRPSTVALADRVALLEGGRIVAVGTHRELLATEPRYRAILSEERVAAAVGGEEPSVAADAGRACP